MELAPAAGWPGPPGRGRLRGKLVLPPGARQSGAAEWTYTTGDFVYSSPAVADGVVYTGSGDGNVYAFGLSGGTTGGVRRPAPASLRLGRHLRTSRDQPAR